MLARGSVAVGIEDPVGSSGISVNLSLSPSCTWIWSKSVLTKLTLDAAATEDCDHADLMGIQIGEDEVYDVETGEAFSSRTELSW